MADSHPQLMENLPGSSAYWAAYGSACGGYDGDRRAASGNSATRAACPRGADGSRRFCPLPGQVFFSPNLFPRAAFVDPSLACSAPPRITAEVGVDAFVQGLEAFVSPTAQPFSDTFALEAVRLAVHWLPAAVRDPADTRARELVALAALLSLFAINQAGVGGIHAPSNPLSARYNIHHGRALRCRRGSTWAAPAAGTPAR